MTETLYTSHATLEKLGSLHRRAHLETGEKLEMGFHGPIAPFFKLVHERELPLPVDYIVAAAGG